MKVHSLFFLLICFISANLSAQMYNAEDPNQIKVGAGPEDFVLDTLSGTHRLIVSCAERREDKPYTVDFWEIDLTNHATRVLPRTNEPEGIEIHLHGIDLVKGNDGKNRIYAISHGLSQDDETNHILVYELLKDKLVFEKMYSNPDYLISPNDVTATPDGTFYISNDYGGGMKLVRRVIFRINASNIASFDGTHWKIHDGKYKYSNGMRIRNNTLYMTTTTGGAVYQLQVNDDHSLTNEKRLIKGLNGLDNITFMPDGKLLTTRHTKNFAFVAHAKNETKPSPFEVIEFDPATGNSKLIRAFSGEEMSAGSTAIYYRGKYYATQVFNPFVMFWKP